MRKGIWIKTGIFVLVVAVVVWNWGRDLWFIPIQVVSLEGKLQYAEPALVKTAMADEVSRGFFGMRINVMRDRLLEVPWLIGASVARKWPHTVLLKVTERQPLALWGHSGVIDTTGKLFYPPNLANIQGRIAELPEFVGPQTRLSLMVETYLQILAKIKPIGLTVKRLIIMPDNGWQAMLDNGVTIILGQQELEERLTRFVLAYGDQKSGLRERAVRTIDLRYTNGLAVNGQ